MRLAIYYKLSTGSDEDSNSGEVTSTSSWTRKRTREFLHTGAQKLQLYSKTKNYYHSLKPIIVTPIVTREIYYTVIEE